MAEVQEGEEVRAGVPIVDIVNPNTMRVRARVNQADINELQIGQAGAGSASTPIPSCVPRPQVAQISPLGVMSTLSPKVRAFVVLIDIEGSHPNLMPDLTASLDVELAREPARSSSRATPSATTASARSSACSAARRSRIGRSRSAR